MMKRRLDSFISDKIIERLDAWCAKQPIPPPRSAAVRKALDLGVRQMENELPTSQQGPKP